MVLSVLHSVLQQSGPIASPPAILIGLVVLAVIIFVGRFVLAIAWRLVLIALAIAAGLWLLGVLGFNVL